MYFSKDPVIHQPHVRQSFFIAKGLECFGWCYIDLDHGTRRTLRPLLPICAKAAYPIKQRGLCRFQLCNLDTNKGLERIKIQGVYTNKNRYSV